MPNQIDPATGERVAAGGNQIDPATGERVKQKGPAPVTATLSAAPKPSWLDDAGNDLREGGSRTVVGRALGRMQGRGDKGYTGLESGVSKGAADIVGSPELGAVETVQGLAKMKEHPLKGAWDTVKGVAHMAEIPSMVMGGAATEEAPAVISSVIEKLPTAARGAKRLNDVMEVAGELPVNLARTSEHLLRASDLADTGATLPGPIKKLLKVFNKGQEIDYATARDFYSNLSHLSSKDNMALTPSMRRQVALIVHAMKDDIGDTAGQVDKAAQYYAGMKDYARAMKAARIKNAIVGALKSKLVQGAVGGIGGGAASYAAAKAISKEAGMQPDNELMPGGTGDISALPAPLQRVAETARIVKGDPTATYGKPDIATVDEDPRTITVRDPSRMEPQVMAHEYKHLLDRNLAPGFRAQFPKDDPKNPYLKPEDLYNLPAMRQKGMSLKNLPEEKQAQLQNAWIQYQKDPEMRKILQPWIQDMNSYPMSNVLPTDPDQKGINTTPRAPAPPSSAYDGAPAPRAQGKPAGPIADYMVEPSPKGLAEQGNLPIWTRPTVQNADGSHSSELSFSREDNGKEVLVPSIVNGRFLTPDGKEPPLGYHDKTGKYHPTPQEKTMQDRAWDHYKKTGQHLGKFDNPDDADAYADKLHNRGTRGTPSAPPPAPRNATDAWAGQH